MPDLIQRLRQLKRSGIDHIRVELTLRETAGLRCGDASHPVYAFLQELKSARLGLGVTAVVGVGSKGALPPGLSVDDPGYIHRVSKSVGNAVYVLAPLGLITKYQIENELNAAGHASLPILGWREGKRWWDPAFKVALLRSLYSAVKSNDPAAKVTTNIADNFCDPARKQDRLYKMATKQPTGLAMWRFGLASLRQRDQNLKKTVHDFASLGGGGRLDEIGIDLYPNYVLPRWWTRRFAPKRSSHPMSGVLGARRLSTYFADRVALHREASGIDTVTIAETGYPGRSCLPIPGFNSLSQAEYLAEALAAAKSSGAAAVTLFRLHDLPVERKPHEAKRGRRNSAAAPNVFDFNRGLEPYFGILDHRLKPKTCGHRPGCTRSAWASVRQQVVGKGSSRRDR